MSDPLAPVEKKTKNTPGQNEHAYWLREIHAAEEREKTWRKDAEAVVDLYEGQKSPENSFNVLYSNTETLLPAIYNSVPRPIVDRRYKDEDPLGLAVSQVVKRGLEYCIDTPDTRYTSFNELVEQGVIGGLVPGRSVTRFKYDVDMIAPGQTDEVASDAVSAGGNKDPEDQSDTIESAEVVPEQEKAKPSQGEVQYETVCGVNWPYDRFLHGFARRWSDVPWIAYEHRMTKADIISNFGAQWVEKLKVTDEETKKGDNRTDDKDSKGAPKSAVVYEIWHKSRKKVIFVGRDHKDEIIKRLDDPLGLPGFYDCPQPLHFLNRNANLVPVVPYKLYEQQAKELNRVTMRINKIISALKVRGFYNGQIKDLNDLMTMEENRLVPANTTSVLAETGGLDKHIWMMPLEKLIQVLQQLYVQREQVKQVIYEITGISDILRGSSVASETATAQNIKNQWGTLRLKKMQKQAQEYVRGCIRIIAAIQGLHFSQETWAKMTGLKYPTMQEKQQAMALLQQMQAQQAMQPPAPAVGGGPPGMPAGGPPGAPPGPPAGGQPPAPPPPPSPQMQKVAEIANSPITWDDILGVMKDNFQRGFKIDIETNSTVDTDATEDKQNITDLLTAISQSLQAFLPMVEQGGMPMGVVKAMLLTITRRFNFGPELEKQLAAMPDEAPQKPDPAMMKMQGEQQKMQQEAQIAQQQAALDMKAKQMDMALKEKEMQQKMILMDKELEIKQQELALKEQELAMKDHELQQKSELNNITHTGKMQAAEATRATKLMQIEMQHKQAMQPPAPEARQ